MEYDIQRLGLIEKAKQNHFLKTGSAIAKPRASSKNYWSLMNTILKKATVPIIPIVRSKSKKKFSRPSYALGMTGK